MPRKPSKIVPTLSDLVESISHPASIYHGHAAKAHRELQMLLSVVRPAIDAIDPNDGQARMTVGLAVAIGRFVKKLKK